VPGRASPAHHHSGQQAGWYNVRILEPKAAAPFFLALLIGGCPKRQTAPRVVYVQPPPASASAAPNQAGGSGAANQDPAAANQAEAPAGSTEAMVIEEPPVAPPHTEPEVTAPPAATASPVPAPKKGRTGRPKTDSHDAEEETEPADSAVPASLPANQAEVPSLEPRPDPGHDEVTQDQFQAQLDEIKRRITELEKKPSLNAAEQRTLTDANSFWSQSVTALHDHDLLRVRELAQKASLLLSALEKH